MNERLASMLTSAAFEARYAASADPWNFEGSIYEQERYDATLSILARPHYETVYEPGCSIGVLTARLAVRADRIIASDVSPSALARAERRCARYPHVSFVCESAASYLPEVPLDLVVFSEIGYYFVAPMLAAMTRRLAGCLRARGEFVAVHWLGHSEDHVMHGDEVHDVLQSSLPLLRNRSERARHYRIDSWVKP